MVATLSNLGGSDAAGNGLGEAFAAIEIILVWLLLAVLFLSVWAKGNMPLPAALAGLVLIPASGVAAGMALDLLSKPYLPPYLWPIVAPALTPPLVVAFCLCTLLPKLRSAIPARASGVLAWGLILASCIAIWPMMQVRSTVHDDEDKIRAAYDAGLAAIKPGAPLWEWTPFLATPDSTKGEFVITSIRHLDRRQSEAETMLDRGDFPIGYLGRLDLEPTPAICEKAHVLLRKRVAVLVLAKPGSKPYAEIALPVSDAVAALDWLVGYGCASNAEAQAWEDMANGYRGSNFDLVRLRELRDPANLGRTLRESPERFSMLTPQAHLKAWLKFADDKATRDQALAGARKLDHRTADAIEMLNEKYNPSAPWAVIKYLPVLDLDTTPQFCTPALRMLRGDMAKVYRPTGDDPRPYSELLDRLGAYEPLTALIWLAAHGCDADAELGAAQSLVSSYRDTPGRAAMLSTLAGLRKPP